MAKRVNPLPEGAIKPPPPQPPPPRDAISLVLGGIVADGQAELLKMEQAGLERYWHFEWDDAATMEVNLYRFHRALDLYGGFCRRWEDMHNGICCVVERVRDTYLMPKIREFAARVRAAAATGGGEGE